MCAKHHSKIRQDRSFHIVNYIFMTLVGFIVLYPLIYVVSSSFSSAYAVKTGKIWLWPVEFTLDGYKAVFQHSMLMSGFANSLLYTVFGTVVNVVLLMMTAFPLSRKGYPIRTALTFYFTFTMFFNGGTIPNYLLVRNLGMMNSRLALIIPFAFSAYNMLIVKTYFQSTIPSEMHEAASIDGCGAWRFFLRIALPLATPIIAVMTLLHGIGHWNGYMRGLLYLNDPSKYTLQQVLRDILLLSQLSADQLDTMAGNQMEEVLNAMELIKYAVIVVGALPMMILYPFVQKYFVKGMMIGAVKG